MRRDVERRVLRPHRLRRDGDSGDVSHFARRALLDRYLIAGRKFQIDR
jgi:hypothetical protein